MRYSYQFQKLVYVMISEIVYLAKMPLPSHANSFIHGKANLLSFDAFPNGFSDEQVKLIQDVRYVFPVRFNTTGCNLSTLNKILRLNSERDEI